MGVPSFFRWLRQRYPLILSKCIETEEEYSPETPNPNTVGDREFDNLYLDMNGIIHPCFHPVDFEQPKNMDEIFENIDMYVDRIFNLIRPRRVLFMAIDGVAPHAKMNQQRLRRFRAAKEAEYSRYKKSMEPEITPEERAEIFKMENNKNKDTNVITPGTEFMLLLSDHIRDYIKKRQSESVAWSSIAIILSDASIPGEGEHKIMEFIRSQRLQPGYDPQMRHCVYGLDADFLFLGLCSHEVFFTILREEVFDVKPEDRPAGRFGPAKFLFVSGWVFRQYLARDLKPSGIKFDFNLEYALDDIAFLCCAAGNDFLPAVPGLKIPNGAVSLIIDTYRNELPKLGGYITQNGIVNTERACKFLGALTKYEEADLETIVNPSSISESISESVNKQCLGDYSLGSTVRMQFAPVSEIPMDIKVSEGDVKAIYYGQKFKIDRSDKKAVSKIAEDYLRGMSWTIQYYLHGCPSWDWYYPYHYAPLLSDFAFVSNSADVSTFTEGRPISPLLQLMSVLPPQSAYFLPEAMSKLMTDEESPLAQFYPKVFEVDMLGAQQSWRGVALLPFLDGGSIEKAVSEANPELTETERRRNEKGRIRVYVNAEEGPTDGSLLFGTLEKSDDGGFFLALDVPERSRILSFLPLNVQQPKDIVGGAVTGRVKPNELPLSIPGIPAECKPAFRTDKIAEIEMNRAKIASGSLSLSRNKKKKMLSF